MNKQDRIQELIRILNDASLAYYQADTEIMQNYEYDSLYDELVFLEKDSGLIFPNSPTQNVGFEIVSSLSKVKHDSKMLSLDKTKEISKLKSFLLLNEGLLSFKLDGLTIVLKYNNGILQQAVTRGNGEIGEDVTHNAKVFKNIPIKIAYNGKLTIRGEAVIGYQDFNKINEQYLDSEKYKNPRNLCSGTVRQLNSEIADKRNVNFFAFSLVDVNDIDFKDKKSNQLEWLKKLGFSPVYYKNVNKDNIEEMVKEFEEKITSNDFGSDGLVLTYDSLSFSKDLGSTSKYPKDSIAFKWADELQETELIKVDWNTSRTGLINPIAIFKPIELEGTTVEKASLHNLSIVESLKLGIGDKITVYKANMIIPQILDNLTKSDNLEIPSKCNVCGENTEIIKLKEVKVLKCINSNCKAQLVGFLVHFASRDAMNIEGLSEATIEKFVEKGFLNSYYDIFNLNKKIEEIKIMDGFGEKSCNKLIKNIENSKTVSLDNFIYSLGINQVGLSNAKLLCKYFDYSFEKIINANETELYLIEGFGEVISKSIANYFNTDENKKTFLKTLNLLSIQKPEILENDSILQGVNFVITGSLNKFQNRKELEDYITKNGGKITSSVSKNTSYLINNDTDSTSSKNKKAEELNVPIISEDKFIELFNNNYNL